MSPAGAGVARFGTHTNKPLALTGLLATGLAATVALLSTGNQATAHTAPPPVAALSPAWNTFQADCTTGPSAGQGSSPQACVCWETNLQAAAIEPAYAVDALNAAQVGGGPAYTVLQNVGNVAISNAAQGCGLYQ